LLAFPDSGGAISVSELKVGNSGQLLNIPSATFPGVVTADFTLDLTPVKDQGRSVVFVWITLAEYTYRTQIAVSLTCLSGDAVLQSTGQCVPCDQIPASQLDALSPGDRLVFERNCISPFDRQKGMCYLRWHCGNVSKMV